MEDYRAYGLLARGAVKGPGSREYSYKWLQSLKAIVIDNKRCPVAAEEFLNYEYERDKDGKHSVQHHFCRQQAERNCYICERRTDIQYGYGCRLIYIIRGKSKGSAPELIFREVFIYADD